MSPEDLEEMLEDHFEQDFDIDEQDYGIIVSADGQLKMILMPEDSGNEQVPQILVDILRMLVDSAPGRSVH
jgi:hypothetical protein